MLTLAVAANCDSHADEIVQRDPNWSGRGYRCKQNYRCNNSYHRSNEPNSIIDADPPTVEAAPRD
jgi:hypothetical protein